MVKGYEVVIGLETYAKPELEAISFTGGEK